MCMCLCVNICEYKSGCSWSPEEGAGHTGAGVIGICEPHEGSFGNWTGSSVRSVSVLDHWAIPSDIRAWIWLPWSSCWHSDSGSVAPWGVETDILYYKHILGYCGVAVNAFELSGIKQPHSVDLIKSIWWQWTFWQCLFFSQGSPSALSKGIIHGIPPVSR